MSSSTNKQGDDAGGGPGTGGQGTAGGEGGGGANNNNNNRKNAVFPVGRAGKSELRRALRAASNNPQKTIENFQRQHSLHSMMCKAFGTQPRYEIQTTRAKTRKASSSSSSSSTTQQVESLDSDSVMEFLSHLGVSQYEVHKRISDTLLKRLEDEIKRTSTEQPLLDLLQTSWAYAVALPELRPIIWAVLRQLGEKTPPDVLLELARRADDTDNNQDNNNNNNNNTTNKGRSILKHAEIFRPLPVLLKKLVWEGDFYNLIPPQLEQQQQQQQPDNMDTITPTAYLEQARGTLWYQTIAPTLQQYCQNKTLVQAANRMLGVGPRERKIVTTHRRALTTAAAATTGGTASAVATTGGTTTTTAAASSGTTTAAALLRGATGTAAAAPSSTTAAEASSSSDPPSGKAIAQLRVYLSDKGSSSSSGSSSSYRPKLLYALLSILVAQHGAVMTGGGGGGFVTATGTGGALSGDYLSSQQQQQQQQYHGYLGGATYLHCTLLADLLMSAGGPLPKAYQHVISLARILDECVQEGTVSDKALVKVQSVLKQIFQPDPPEADDATATTTTTSSAKKAPEKSATTETTTDTKGGGGKKTAISSFTSPISSAAKRQLNRILTSAMEAMKMADPQSLFLNDVTDEIAPGYSKIIKKPVCISAMEKKVSKNAYENLAEFEHDVQLMFQNCVDYNRGAAGQWFRGEAQRQKKVFREEILPQARKLYQSEIVKRKTPLNLDEEDKAAAANDRKRKAETLAASLAAGGPVIAAAASHTFAIQPLPAVTKKRKKEKESEYLPSMPALALMLLADPFVVRIILARVLRELRASVVGGNSVPAAHAAIPSLLQLLHMAHWSSQICAIRGKRYFVPSAGVMLENHNNTTDASSQDPTTLVPYATLRQDTPLVLRLLLEAELDKRMVVGGDLYDASQSSTMAVSLPSPISVQQWGGEAVMKGENNTTRTYYMQVAISLLQVALVHVCQPADNDTSLAMTFPKFATALEQIASPAALMGDSVFFKCLIFAILRHKQRLKPVARDAIVHSWMGWLRVATQSSSSSGGSGSKKKKKRGCMTMAVHEFLIMLLNDWSSIGNLLLPRDTLLQFATDIVQTANDTEVSDERRFTHLWNLSSSFEEKDQEGNIVEPPPLITEFSAVYKQYQRLLKSLPAINATQWKEQVGIGQPTAEEEEAAAASDTEPPPTAPVQEGEDDEAAATHSEGDDGDAPEEMETD